MKYLIPLLTIISLSFLGCATELKVESDTSWSGAINNTTVDGSGSKTFDMKSSSCAVFQKQTKNGSLKITVTGFWGEGEHAETTAEYGVVSACASGGN